MGLQASLSRLKSTTRVTTRRHLHRLQQQKQKWKQQQHLSPTTLQRSIVASSFPVSTRAATKNAIVAMSTTASSDSFENPASSFAPTAAVATAAAIFATLFATSTSLSSSTATSKTTACDEAPADDDSIDPTTTTNVDNLSNPYSTPKPSWTPASVANDKFDDVVKHSETEIDNFPVYTSEQVAENDGSDGKPIWMSYGGVVYDVTAFIHNHPGGSEKILMAAGSVSICLFIYFQESTVFLFTRSNIRIIMFQTKLQNKRKP